MTHKKIDKARALADCGRYPRTFGSIIESMPIELLERCSAKTIAETADLIWRKGKADAQGN